jgi:pseudouridine kinase
MEYPFSPSPESPVLVVGAAGVDIVGALKGEPHMGTSNPSRIRSSFGGVARNVSENLARLGQPVRLLTAVGEDEVGGRLLEQVACAGVDVSAALRTPDKPTGTYLAVVDSKGALQFALDDMYTVSSLSKDTLRKAVSLARRARIPICADPTSAALAGKLRPYLSKMNLIVPNCNEAGVLCDQTIDASKRRQTLEAAKCLVNQGVELAIITLAQYGVCYATSQTSGRVPAIRTEIIDPTGGGDALTAAVIFALLNDIPLDDAVRLGVSAATYTLCYSGAVVPDLTLEKLYDRLII